MFSGREVEQIESLETKELIPGLSCQMLSVHHIWCLYIISGVCKVLVIYCKLCTWTRTAPTILPLSSRSQWQGIALSCTLPFSVTLCREMLILSWSTFEYGGYGKVTRGSQGSFYANVWGDVKGRVHSAGTRAWCWLGLGGWCLLKTKYGKESE